ncbi:aspartate racemase [Pseudonocardia sp. TMWB2A]|uniref:aspartate/glutamate racemase family protein n=1 Tax=Pseudonocardia sp. TMWB2A TaxID=687430 RepID=UPI00307DE0C6
MRKLGLIGGMSWVSTETYYRIINQQIQKRVGGMCSAPLVVESLNFCDLSRIETDEQWAHATEALKASAKRLEKAGATAILICANSMHKVYDEVQKSVKIPILHIVDAIGAKMQADGVQNAALIGTHNVMTGKWYRQRLVGHGISLKTVGDGEAEKIDKIIYDDLMFGRVTRDAERELKTYITNIDQADFDAVVLGCTELDLIVDTKANVLPIYDSTELHALAGVEWILGDAP